MSVGSGGAGKIAAGSKAAARRKPAAAAGKPAAGRMPAAATGELAADPNLPLPEAGTPPPLYGDALTHFSALLADWFRLHARTLPWRGIQNPYATWLSEIMLQQTRVATVMERYVEFLRRFPTLEALAEASVDDVLALWSGLGYYRRARMLHRAAQFVVRELGGNLPQTAHELRTLPGVGDYTSAAIASIAFGENVAVVDGNVERVLLRITGQPEEQTAAARARVADLAQALMPGPQPAPQPARPGTARSRKRSNPAGDHNQAMMELGATICLPRGPLCLQCPVVSLCRTRGEHVTAPREKQKSRQVAHLFLLREHDGRTEVLLEQRARDASLMAGMFELPPLPLDAVKLSVPLLRVRHAITNTNYQVEVFSSQALRAEVPAQAGDLHWAAIGQLTLLPLTGLARKCLIRLRVMELE